MGQVGEPFAPVFICVEGKHKTLAGEDTNKVAYRWLNILKKLNIWAQVASLWPKAVATTSFSSLRLVSHVVLLPNDRPNNKFERRNKSMPRFNILVPGGDSAYNYSLSSIKIKIGEHRILADHAKQHFEAVEAHINEESIMERKDT
jgi:hypothetical protein